MTAMTAGAVSTPGFGEALTGHMVTSEWTPEDTWRSPLLRPYGDLRLDPAAAGLHYGQVVFEGLKAHRRVDGSIALFRPDRHAQRFADSARRLAMPPFPQREFLEAATDLVRADAGSVPADGALSLYLRPVLFATEASLALRPARQYMFLLVAFVTGGFFGDLPEPVSVMVSRDYTRAAPGGVGEAKTAGNYAASYLAQLRAEEAGCRQVVWLDAAERRWVEELGATNIFFVRDRRLVTPPLTGTLLPGVTRDSLMTLAAELGYPVAEERVSVDQWRAECEAGVITETFACGTAAVVTPIGSVHDAEGDWTIGGGVAGPVALALREALVALHRGRAADRHDWLLPVH